LAFAAAWARLTAPIVTTVQASTFSKDFDVNFILFLGLRLIVNSQGPTKNTLGVYASRVLLQIKTIFPSSRLQAFFQSTFLLQDPPERSVLVDGTTWLRSQQCKIERRAAEGSQIKAFYENNR
jgi:hypothetical protein